jgi:hypothetical protein
MEEEKSAFFTNGTWEIVPTHHTWNLLSFKWVFKIKVDENGTITRYRARLVAKGFLQREGLDYGDIFSHVVRYSTLRLLLALAARYGLYKRHLDCPKAFTQANLDTPCYMKPPPGMSIGPGYCLKLLKSVYGLKQASRLLHELQVSFLLTLGFVANLNDTCVKYLGAGLSIALLAIYVDDLLLFTTTPKLGDEITTIVARYEFEDLQSVPTPMLHDLKLTKDDCPTTDEAKEAMRAYPFRSAISSLMFAMVAMRADQSYVVTCIARFSANPGLPHWNALVRLYQYIKGTADLKLTYSRMADTPAPLMYGYSDADWATTDIDERHTCIGYCLFLSGAVILSGSPASGIPACRPWKVNSAESRRWPRTQSLPAN